MSDLTPSVRLSRIFGALSDPLRRQVLEALIAAPGRTVNELCEQFPVSRFVIMRHLNVLEDAGLLERKRDGKEKHLHALSTGMDHTIRDWLETLEQEEK